MKNTAKNKIIKKSNNLVEASYNLSLWEMRILLKMTSFIHINDKDFEVYELDVKDIKEFFGVEGDGSVYTYIKDSVRSLMDKKVIISTKLEDGKTKETTIPMVIEMTRIVEEKSSISLSFHPLMKPYLLDLKNRFLTYDVDNVLRLTSTYAIRLYELTMAYEGIGKRTFTVEGLKKILGIENKYKQYSHLKQRILEPSKENINQTTDLNLDYVEIREGRRIAKICFIINKKKAIAAQESKPEKSGVLESYGVSKGVAAKWRKQYSEAHIAERIAYMNNQISKGTVIKNKAGYLSTVMDKNITPKKPKKDITQKVNGILFSRPNLQKQIEAKYGVLSQEAMNAIVKSKFPERFEE